ncbi:hypothetical protein BT96DRAFT_929143 [Gymnopus androsaceus JB14]|uniref:Uncharacterized protein n=1 Tax=Gymnopus androsaceus JB14 TaxID=1447944 RepID=A0A6A4GGI5_9AGAR|nr:hypothetical protein BT96DRAFT_929143 [Gymnopus androsaceus JB14]
MMGGYHCYLSKWTLATHAKSAQASFPRPTASDVAISELSPYSSVLHQTFPSPTAKSLITPSVHAILSAFDDAIAKLVWKGRSVLGTC